VGLLEGKVAIITGSDSGIGGATAEVFGREGADVAVTCLRDRDAAEETCQIAPCERRAEILHVDLRGPEAVKKLFRETEEQLDTP